jgi:hypothetical protein
MPTIVYPVPYVPVSGLTFSRRAAVPIRYACVSIPPNFLSEQTDGWNCNLCGGAKAFYQPYVKGDIIPFQTQFADNYNMPPDTITAGIYGVLSPTDYYVKIELLDGTGATVTDVVEDFCSEYYVSNSLKTGSLQTWFVNTGLLPTDLKCWQLKITYYKIDQTTMLPVVERVIYTQEYKEVEECEDTVKIESYYSNYDCNGNWYGTPTNTLGNSTRPYYNSLRVYGEVELFGETVSETTNDRGVVISSVITNSYKILSGAVPPYYYQKISQAVRGNAVFVDGKQYIKFELSQKEDELRMFTLDIAFVTECRLDNKSCNF